MKSHIIMKENHPVRFLSMMLEKFAKIHFYADDIPMYKGDSCLNQDFRFT